MDVRKEIEMRYKKYYILLAPILLSIILVFTPLESPFFLTGFTSVEAKITGNCANCHTMHNSQGGSAMATYGGGTGPNSCLTRGTCFGCHGQGTSKIVTIGGSDIPQVYHTGTLDLAGGNFKHIETGGDNRGHNIIELNNLDDVLDGPPGPVKQYNHAMAVRDINLTCAGENGCHGTNRYIDLGSGIKAVKGAHHGNVDGKCDTPDTVAKSYRFLWGVKGLENTVSKWQNASPTDHNEYFGATPPPSYGCSAVTCHIGPGYSAASINKSISGFCGTCHGNFHGVIGGTGSGTSDGIGIGGTSSPFKRHPTDIVLKGSGEYTAYTTYSVQAPVARPTVYDTPSSVVNPGTDVVMCLSCHGAHATNYPDILKWDYTTMIAGGGGSGGCFTCHTQKKNPP